MADESMKNILGRLESLDPAARTRIESALKNAIEREAVAGSLGGAAAANIFSRGWVFSRLTPTATDIASIYQLPGVDALTVEQFTDFAGRLAELKKKSDPTG